MSTVELHRSGPAKKKRGPIAPDRMSAALMLIATALAIIWANSPWGAGYEHFWETSITIAVGDMQIDSNLHALVNDGLMTLFFFLVGLEVKRELTIGELTDRARATLPIAAAVAGLVVPAGIFILFTLGTDQTHAWGVVISTDTAFLLGALAIIGPKFPARLRAFLLTLAVVDDIGALLVIGVFYSESLDLVAILVAVVLMGLIALVRFLPYGRGFSYAALGIALWVVVLLSGVHATLAGVAIALLIPVFPPRRSDVERTAELTRAFRESPNTVYAAAVQRSVRDSLSINERVDAAWRPYISFGVLPLFALANAGVHLDPATLKEAFTSPLTWGIIVALVAGKFVGITGATWLLRATGKGVLAPGLGMTRIAGGGALSGIGFTIALFLVPIAIDDPHTQDLARVGVLTASVLAFLAGWAIISIGDRIRPPVAVGKFLNRPVDPARDHIKGPKDAPLTIVEYGDFECPFCGRATGSIDEVFAALGDQVRWVWRHLPLDAPHPHAQQAAQASEAAAAQGHFYEMTRKMFAHQDQLELSDLIRYADELGLDTDRFADDLGSPAVLRHIQDDRFDAELMDLHSTPTFFIGGVRHVGPWDSASLIRALEASRGRVVDAHP